MKFLYVARHGQARSNDDEGAVSYALEALGHEVFKLPERGAERTIPEITDVDVLLFHKWDDVKTLRRVSPKVRKVFWYFDLVDFPSDPTLRTRCNQRKDWMRRITPLVDLGFCTDGDWVGNDRTGKLVTLRQGADQRVVRAGTPEQTVPHIPILFTGISQGGGLARESFVRDVASRHKDFVHVRAGRHGVELRDLIASSKIVLAPDSPVTDRYWSNRAYLTLGFGGFLLHPYCGLEYSYRDREDVVFYRDRDELHYLIDHYLPRTSERERVARNGLEATKQRHLYRHRVEEMVRVIQERLP